jgi:hypothetical protein
MWRWRGIPLLSVVALRKIFFFRHFRARYGIDLDAL